MENDRTKTSSFIKVYFNYQIWNEVEAETVKFKLEAEAIFKSFQKINKQLHNEMFVY